MSVKKIKVVNIRKFLIAFSIFFATAACAAPPVLMGKCGASLNFMRKGVILEDDHALSGIGVINFDNKTVAGSIISYNSKNSKKTSLTNLNWMF